MKLKLVTITLALSLNAIASADSVKDSITAAKSAQKEAKTAGFEWRDMGKMIKKAEKLAKEGKDKKAIKVANTVVMHSKVALKQAAVAKSAGPRF